MRRKDFTVVLAWCCRRNWWITQNRIFEAKVHLLTLLGAILALAMFVRIGDISWNFTNFTWTFEWNGQISELRGEEEMVNPIERSGVNRVD